MSSRTGRASGPSSYLQIAAGKTGTTDEKRNAWFVGYTPQLVAAVWMGDPAAYTPMLNVGRLGAVFGGTYPAIIWQKFMSTSLVGHPARILHPAGPEPLAAGPLRQRERSHRRAGHAGPPAPVDDAAGSVLRVHPRRAAATGHAAAVGSAGDDTTGHDSAAADAMSHGGDR